MSWARVSLASLLLLAAAGCGRRPKAEITSLQRKEAANFVSEAEFALTLRDFARAEGLYAKAAAECSDTGEYWLALGSTRMRLGQRGGAKSAYQSAYDAFDDQAAKDRNDPQPVLQQVTVLALLGRVDDARALIAKLPERFPTNPTLRGYVDGKQLDRLLADPKFKEVAL